MLEPIRNAGESPAPAPLVRDDLTHKRKVRQRRRIRRRRQHVDGNRRMRAHDLAEHARAHDHVAELVVANEQHIERPRIPIRQWPSTATPGTDSEAQPARAERGLDAAKTCRDERCDLVRHGRHEDTRAGARRTPSRVDVGPRSTPSAAAGYEVRHAKCVLPHLARPTIRLRDCIGRHSRLLASARSRSSCMESQAPRACSRSSREDKTRLTRLAPLVGSLGIR